MSERGRGSGPPEEHSAGEEEREEPVPRRYPQPPGAAHPIAPYDPYRPASGDAPRRSTRNVADPYASATHSSRGTSDDPYLPDDDPLSAEAWQLELDEEVVLESDVPAPDIERAPSAVPAPRRGRRRSPATRGEREPAASVGRAARRSRASGVAGASARRRAAQGMASLGVPRVVTGSPLLTDQAAVALLAINGMSIVVMALLLALRLGGIPSPTVLQLDAAGNPSLWGSPSVLWRLPLMSFFISLMALVVAWFVHPIDRFAARFTLGAAIVAQVIAWTAVIQHLV